MDNVEVLHVVIPGPPIAQPRHRISTISVPGRARPIVRKYLPSSKGRPHPVHAFKATIRHIVAESRKAESCALETGPLDVRVVMVFPRPKHMTKKRGPNDSYPHTVKPDADNCAKAVLDALNGVLWADDGQVSTLSIVKRVASASEAPRSEIIVNRI